ncbi:flagellar cap protein FliD, partial [bacterium]|nr:flagellar cap protein FliD [bacterium]
MSTISFGGLATGIDSNTIVDKLVALEKIPATKLQSRQAAADKRIALLSDLSTKLTALG